MSARREARARVPALERIDSSSAMPAALAIGRCVEVWSQSGDPGDAITAKRRFETVRKAWGDRLELDPAELRELIPHSSPWSVQYLIDTARERTGRTGPELVAERLDRAGCTIADLPALRAEAEQLYLAYKSPPKRRRHRHHLTGDH